MAKKNSDREKQYLGAGREPSPSYKGAVGHGVAGDCYAMIFDSFANTPIDAQPELWSTEVVFNGPLTAANAAALFADDGLDLFDSGSDVPGAAVVIQHGDNWDDGRLDGPALICGVFFRVRVGPWCWTVPGNAVGTTTAGIANGFVSPDEYTSADVSSLEAVTSLGLPGASAINLYGPASADFNTWAERGLSALVEAGEFHWRVGKCDILRRPLGDVAYWTSGAQNGTSAGSPVDPRSDIYAMNANYATNLASTMTFLTRNARRTGSVTDAAGHIISKFSPDSTYDLVVPTYGGTLGPMLQYNRRTYQLTQPVVMGCSKRLHMRIRTENTIALATAIARLSAQDGSASATIPPVWTDGPPITATNGPGVAGTEPGFNGTLPAFTEQSSDSPAALVQLQVPNGRYVFKAGSFAIEMGAVGIPLTSGQYNAIIANEGDISGMLASQNCKGLLCCE